MTDGADHRGRVVLIANSIEEVGGAQRVVHVLAQGLARRGYRVDLVGIAPDPARHEYLENPAFRRITVMSEPWPPPPRDNRLATRLRPSVRAVIRRRARLRREAIARLEAVLAEGPAGVVITAQLWAMEHLAEVPHDDWAVIGQYHSSFEAAAAGRDLDRALTLYGDVDRFVLLTPDDADQFRRRGLNNTDWLPNPLAFWPEAATHTASARTVLYLGRLSGEKGPGFLIDAWGIVAPHHPDWRLRIVGSGPDEDAVRRRIAALPSGADRVDLIPPVRDAEAELRQAGVLVLPSLTEGLPLSLAEAMAHGVPCVASDCSAGVRLLAQDGSAARLVPRADAAAIAVELDRLLADPRSREELGARARDSVTPYRSEVILDAWEGLFARVLR